MVNLSLLAYALRRKLKNLGMAPVLKALPGMLGIAVIAGGVSWFVARTWTRHVGHENFLSKLGEVFIPITAATAVYLGLSLWLKTGYAEEMLKLVSDRFKRLRGAR
jgi:peptidoglycan biosynthesis protein MviN/MurJ (putative lipid II flippase)